MILPYAAFSRKSSTAAFNSFSFSFSKLISGFCPCPICCINPATRLSVACKQESRCLYKDISLSLMAISSSRPAITFNSAGKVDHEYDGPCSSIFFLNSTTKCIFPDFLVTWLDIYHGNNKESSSVSASLTVYTPRSFSALL